VCVLCLARQDNAVRCMPRATVPYHRITSAQTTGASSLSSKQEDIIDTKILRGKYDLVRETDRGHIWRVLGQDE